VADISVGESASERWALLRDSLVRLRFVGPLMALLIAVVIFSTTTSTFLTGSNVSLIFQQSVVIGMLALGQTLVILTAGIDLANGAIAVLASVVMAKLVLHDHSAFLALLTGIAVAVLLAGFSGVIVTRLQLPPFIVTLGLLTVVTASARLYTGSSSFPVSSPLLVWLGNVVSVGSLTFSFGTVLWLVAYGVAGYALTQTAWGIRVFAVGNNSEAARLVGVKVERVLLSVYLAAGFCYALAAWEALGRVPNADPSGYQSANLDSITAVVIGGTSLFGGRGGVAGTLIGTLIVTVLRNGLTQAGIDSLYQDVTTGVLVIAAVAVDQLVRRRQR
jgi:fructose transport system permease protein